MNQTVGVASVSLLGIDRITQGWGMSCFSILKIKDGDSDSGERLLTFELTSQTNTPFSAPSETPPPKFTDVHCHGNDTNTLTTLGLLAKREI